MRNIAKELRDRLAQHDGCSRYCIEDAILIRDFDISRAIDPQNPTPPCPELKGLFPVVLYFGTQQEAAGFEELVKQSNPNLVEKPL